MDSRYLVIPLLAATLLAGPAMAEDKPPIVIVHGAWGGPHHWKAVAHSLTHDHGRSVRRASLTGLGERSHLVSREVNLDTHIRDVVNLIEFDDLKSAVLIAHSYGGAVAQGVVDAIPERIAKVIYVDSSVLEDGECVVTHNDESRHKYTQRAKEAGNGYLIPVDWDNPMRDTPHPLATFLQPLKLKPGSHKTVPASYWLLADGKPAEEDDRYRYYKWAIDRGWDAKVFPWGHNPQRDRPADLVNELVKAIP